jgi:hypothetical protein
MTAPEMLPNAHRPCRRAKSLRIIGPAAVDNDNSVSKTTGSALTSYAADLNGVTAARLPRLDRAAIKAGQGKSTDGPHREAL